MGFGCTKCGACCRLASVVAQGLDIEFPYDFNEDGSCSKYNEASGCTIYDDRPEMCRTRLVKDKSEREEYYEKCAMACNTMMDILSIDQTFKIKR